MGAGVRYERGTIQDYDPANVEITGGSINNIDDPVDEHGTGDVDFNDGRYPKKALLDAHSVYKADSDDTPVKLDVAEQRLIGRITGGSIADLTVSQVLTLLGLADALTYKGVIDCAANPNYPAADAGDYYKISVAGKIGGASGLVVELGDALICTTDSTASGDQATVGAFWNVLQTNIDLANPGPIGGTTPAPAYHTILKGENLLLDHNVETLSGNKTLTITDKVIQKLDPDGVDRDVLLPAENTATDLVFFIYNMGGELGEDLNVQDDAAAALEIIHYGHMGICTCDGTIWTVRCLSCADAIDVLSLRVKEENTSPLVIGQPVYTSGASGVAFPTVGLADCDDANKIKVVGLVAEAISQNTTGYTRVHGLLESVNSTKGNSINPGSEDWTAGDQLYLSATVGGLTNVKPTSGRIVKVGIALTVEGPNSKILVDIHRNPIGAAAASGEDIVRRMGDSDGANKISYRDYANNEVASLDSDGNLIIKKVSMGDELLNRPEIKDYSETKTSPSSASNVLTLDIVNGNVFEVTLTENVTTLNFNNPSPTGKACSFTLILIQDSTPRTVAWPGSVKWDSGTAPTISAASAIYILTFVTVNAGTTWYGFLAGSEMA